MKKVLGDYSAMLDSVLDAIQILNFKSPLICDHICYRVETNEKYEEIKNNLLAYSSLVGETLVSKRLISIFKLNSPIKYNNLTISCVELPAPKHGSKYTEGWEHAEFVIPELTDFIDNNPLVSFNHKAMSRELNPELGYKINNNYQVKFHPLHILDVIKKENELGITNVD